MAHDPKNTMLEADSPRFLAFKDYKTIFLAVLGGALEVYDFVIFVFLSAAIADVFFPPSVPQWLRLLQSLAIFAVGYLARPVGGLFLAHYSDSVGRKGMFNFTVLFMALPCLMIGVLPGFDTVGYAAPALLLFARLVQGAALGGEVPNAWVFVAEHVPPERRGYALGLLQAGLTVGYMLAALTTAVLTSLYSGDELRAWAWRIPFLLGGVFGFIAVWLRRWLRETPVFLELQRRREIEKMPVSSVIRKHRLSAIPSVLLTAILASAVIMMVVVTPIALQKFHGLDASTTFRLSCVAILCLNLGCVVAGRVSDWLGAWRTVGLYSILLAIAIVMLCASFDESRAYLFGSYMLACLLCGIVGAVPAVIVQLFPSNMKVTGISLTYNLTYSICSSVLPLFMLGLLNSTQWGMNALAVVIGALGVLTVVVFRNIRSYS